MAQQHFMSFSDLESSGLLSPQSNSTAFKLVSFNATRTAQAVAMRRTSLKQTSLLMASAGIVKLAPVNKSLYDETAYFKGR